jgi:hypothetical protein
MNPCNAQPTRLGTTPNRKILDKANTMAFMSGLMAESKTPSDHNIGVAKIAAMAPVIPSLNQPEDRVREK